MRCLLTNAGLSKSFWREAMPITCNLINRCSTSAISNKTPIEKWSGKHEDYSNIRVFGCVAYAHIHAKTNWIQGLSSVSLWGILKE